LIAAAYNDVKIDVPAFELHKDNVTPAFLAKNPLGKVLAMVPDRVLF